MCFPAASAVVSFTWSRSCSCIPVPSAALLGPSAEFGHFHICVLTIPGICSVWRITGFEKHMGSVLSLCTVRVCAGSHPAKLEMKQYQSNVRSWDSPGIRDHMVVLAASGVLALSCCPPYWFFHLHFSGCSWHGVLDHGSWMPFSFSVMGSSHSLQCQCLCCSQHQVPPSLSLLQRRQCPCFTLWNSVRLACLYSPTQYPVGS